MKYWNKKEDQNARRIFINLVAFFCGFTFLHSCTKLVQIDPPAQSITTTETFQDSANSESAIAGIYYSLFSNNSIGAFGSGFLTIYAGCSADELIPFVGGNNDQYYYENNLLQAGSTDVVGTPFWNPAYQSIYQANACIDGLQASTGVSATVKTELTGEAKFLRAYCYFYLVNLFGDVPYITSIDFQTTSLAARMPKAQIYQNIINDLTDAQSSLRSDYSHSGSERVRANKWAATALLARAYLYTGDWTDAATQATAVINNASLYSLDTLNGIFFKNSSEAILQASVASNLQPLYNIVSEGFNILPLFPFLGPRYYMSPQLLASFEPGDMRKLAWVDSGTYSGTKYYYPYKYKLGFSQIVPNTPALQYYMILRLGEQYLIRAEAEANGANGGTNAALNDLNTIRTRAGLTNLSNSLTLPETMEAIAHERQIELFAEWGHRWLDLKRTGQVDSVMTIVTPQQNGGGQWQSYQQLYPIPLGELTTDPNLKQNPGY